MKLLYATDAPCIYEDGRYYVKSFEPIINRYHKHFGNFVLVHRNGKRREGVTYTDITDKISDGLHVKNLFGFINPSRQFMTELKRMIAEADVVALRVPSFSGNLIARMCRKMGKPYLAEVMGCPWDANWNHSLAGKIVAPYTWYKTRQLVKHATWAHYVTSEFLQRRYPTRCLQLAASDVAISPIGEIATSLRAARIASMDKSHIRLMTTAAVNVPYKGQQYAIEAIKLLKEKGIRADYIIVGDGDQSYLKGVAQRCGVSDQVHFTGVLTASEVMEQLDGIDIYVQPSLQEGLPRSVVEAQSRGCPVVGFATGGIPELLPPECVVRRKSVRGIADAITMMLDKGLEGYSRSSFEMAKGFEPDVLAKKFEDFYRQILNHKG